ncbi:MAG: hypothetical protein JO353_01235 [Phycisphaerae bacterium]|nr:hypothetical protein [Phycisphaerae bacterium]
MQKPKNRHLIDVRKIVELPPVQRVENVLVLSPAELIATKAIGYHSRKGQPKSYTDRRDIAVLLLKFPDLKSPTGPVLERLHANNADAATILDWEAIAQEQIKLPTDDF